MIMIARFPVLSITSLVIFMSLIKAPADSQTNICW